MFNRCIFRLDPGELPNNMTFAQASELGLIPRVSADGVWGNFPDTRTPVKDSTDASEQITETLKHAD